MASLGRDELRASHVEPYTAGEAGLQHLVEAVTEVTERDAAVSQATTTAASSQPTQPSRATPARLHTGATAAATHFDAAVAVTVSQATTPVRRPASFDGGDTAGHSIFDGAATTGPPLWSIWSSPTSNHGNSGANGSGKAGGPGGGDGSGGGAARDGLASENDDPNGSLHSPSHSALGASKSSKLGRMLLASSPRPRGGLEDDDGLPIQRSALMSSPLRRFDWFDMPPTNSVPASAIMPQPTNQRSESMLGERAGTNNAKTIALARRHRWAWMHGSGTTTDGAAPDANWVAEYARNKSAALPSPNLQALPYRRTQFEQYQDVTDPRNKRRRLKRLRQETTDADDNANADAEMDVGMGMHLLLPGAAAAASSPSAHATAEPINTSRMRTNPPTTPATRVQLNPRWWGMDPAADLYTPRAIRGSQLEREGLCPICEKPHWLRTRKSVYWSHMQFVHGIDSQTRQPYPPPSLFGMIGTEHESHGFCDRCQTWVRLSKRPKKSAVTPAWFRHSYECRRHYLEAHTELMTIGVATHSSAPEANAANSAA